MPFHDKSRHSMQAPGRLVGRAEREGQPGSEHPDNVAPGLSQAAVAGHDRDPDRLTEKDGSQDFEDQLPGGKADQLAPKDFDPKRLMEGAEHELEHTNDPAIACEIARDHLAEDPDYYQKLRKVEKDAALGDDLPANVEEDMGGWSGKLMPRLKQIHKLGSVGLPDIQDLDAMHQSPGSKNLAASSQESVSTPGPGYEADTHSTGGSWASSTTGDRGSADPGDVPVEQGDEPRTKGYNKSMKGMSKGAGVTGRLTPIIRNVYDNRLDLAEEAVDMVQDKVVDAGIDNAIDYGKEKIKKLRKTIEKMAYSLEGHTKFQGIPISIENGAGSVRSGVDKDGKPWKTEMKYPYGYFTGSEGADGDGVDVYVGPDEEAPNAYVVHQNNIETGKYDEDKVMLGFQSKKDAKEGFLKHYNDPAFLGPIKEVPMDRLQELLNSKEKLTKISHVFWNSMLKEIVKVAGLGGLFRRNPATGSHDAQMQAEDDLKDAYHNAGKVYPNEHFLIHGVLPPHPLAKKALK